MTDFASVQKHLTSITTAQTDFAKSSFEASKAYFEKLAGVKSPDKFFELTTETADDTLPSFHDFGKGSIVLLRETLGLPSCDGVRPARRG
jgi:hypothetical protein